MGDWFIATEGVKIVKDSAGLWPQIITGVLSAGAALGGVWLTHYFARRREERAAAAKLVSERYFIATELVSSRKTLPRLVQRPPRMRVSRMNAGIHVSVTHGGLDIKHGTWRQLFFKKREVEAIWRNAVIYLLRDNYA